METLPGSKGGGQLDGARTRWGHELELKVGAYASSLTDPVGPTDRKGPCRPRSSDSPPALMSFPTCFHNFGPFLFKTLQVAARIAQ
jgi:hypothetical protein